MTDMVANILLIGRMDHTLFRNDRRDQILRRHIESRIENTHALGRECLTEYMRHFLGIALLDGNIFARGTIDIDRRRRPGNKKWNAVAPRQHRDRVSADLVCHVAIGGDSVTTDDYRVDSPLLHKITSHTVGNQRRRDLFLFELPGRESGTLQERPRFIYKN